jgi:hypothetical protein
LADATTQRNAVTANIAAKPLSPMVIDFAEDWLMRILSRRTRTQKPQSRSTGIDRNQVSRRDAIEMSKSTRVQRFPNRVERFA